MLQQVTEGVWTVPAPLSFYGFQIGTRMTVLRLPSGGLWVHSPIALDDALRSEVDALGRVDHIVAPNLFHHLYARHWSEAYPSAKVHAAPGLREKRKDLRVDEVLSERAPEAWGGALEPIAIEGVMMREHVFVHASTRTLVQSDVIENFATSDHWLTRQYLKAGGIHGRPGFSRLLVPVVYRDRKAARRSLDKVLEREFDRITVAHGSNIERDGRGILRESLGWLKG